MTRRPPRDCHAAGTAWAIAAVALMFLAVALLAVSLGGQAFR
jgi:hypothetical protein